MKIVIDIPEEIKQKRDAGKVLSSMEIAMVCMAIKNGIPLPKGHGRLIDADALDMKRIDYIVDGYAHDKDDCKEFGMMIILAPTIIEADGGDVDENRRNNML